MNDALPGIPPMTVEPFQKLAESSSQTLASLNGNMVRAWAGCSRELFELAGDRSKAYSALPTELASCSNAHDLAEFQGRFVQTMMHDYQEHATRMSKLLMGLWAVPASPFGQADDVGHEQPARSRKAATRKAETAERKAA